LAEDARGTGREWSRKHFRRRADEAPSSAVVLRNLLTEHRADEHSSGQQQGVPSVAAT